jgi:hypothetical protein
MKEGAAGRGRTLSATDRRDLGVAVGEVNGISAGVDRDISGIPAESRATVALIAESASASGIPPAAGERGTRTA